MDRPVEGNGGIIGDSNTSISAASIEHTTEGADDNRDIIRGPLNTRNELREHDPTGYDLRRTSIRILIYLWNTNPVNLDYSGHMNQLA